MARATVMASMSPVDLVTLFDEDTPLEMIQALRPDVLVKGSDYTVDQVVGGDLVHGWGGKVVLVTLREGHSTTGTIRRMTAPAALVQCQPDGNRLAGKTSFEKPLVRAFRSLTVNLNVLRSQRLRWRRLRLERRSIITSGNLAAVYPNA